MDASSDHVDSIALSGRTLLARISFAPFESHNWPGAREGAVPDDGRQPRIGDLRLSATVDQDSRSGAQPRQNGKAGEPCTGSLVASIFDGACWQKFDLSCLTTNTRFATPLQLQGAARWACCIVRDAAGKRCAAAVGPQGFVVYAVASVPCVVAAHGRVLS